MQMLDWRPIVGCSPISTGCANCAGAKGADPSLIERRGHRRLWTGEVRINRLALSLPAMTAEPSFVHVCVNGDLFHEKAEDAWIDAVFDAIEAAPHHKAYSILTKRADRMRAYVCRRYPAGAPTNLHIGVSAERQAEANARIADLLATPVRVRFAFFYPLLGPVDVRPFLGFGGLSYLMAGEEHERPAKAEWFAAIAEAAAALGVPFEQSSSIITD